MIFPFQSYFPDLTHAPVLKAEMHENCRHYAIGWRKILFYGHARSLVPVVILTRALPIESHVNTGETFLPV